MIGFMSLSSQFGTSSNIFMSQGETRSFFERSVLGADKGISFDEVGEGGIQEEVSENVLKSQPLSSLQVLYFWNEEQLKLLLSDQHLVLFVSDFGVGKTLLKKHMALNPPTKPHKLNN